MCGGVTVKREGCAIGDRYHSVREGWNSDVMWVGGYVR